MPDAPIAATQSAFLEKFEDLLVGPDPAQGVIRGQRFLHPGLDLALDFPAGWAVQNSVTAVGAASPQRDAVVVLEMQGRPGDPQAAGAKFAQANGIALQNGSRKSLGGTEAYHALGVASTQDGPLTLDLTWIAHAKGVLRLTGMSPQSRYQSHLAELDGVARSFGKLTPTERERIRERRLRVVKAHAGETSGAPSARFQNVGSLDETSVANGLAREPRLEAGQLVNVAVEVPYRQQSE